ncbi:MAG: adenylate/guanylate cyclase domain-containing protein [Eubacteriales bacterium]|nr:adenylate/guanylate cyclase domain-containing protein [Eubacteriales bacterium]
MRKERLRSGAVACCIGLLCFGIVFSQLFSGLDYFAKDLLYSNRRPTSSVLKIIAIDEKAIEQFGPFGTWDRSVYAELLRLLDQDPECRPAVIAFDVLFTGRMSGAGDDAFQAAVQEYGNIISASHLVIHERATLGAGGLSVFESVQGLELPYWLNESDHTVGFSNTDLQGDGSVRKAVLRCGYQSAQLNSFAYQTYLAYCARMERVPLEPKTEQGAFLIDYAGRSGDFETVSLADVWNKTVDPAVFQDCVVLVGAYTTGLQDDFYTGTNRSEKLYGVEIHANILQNLMEGRQLLPVENWLAALIFALAAAVYYLAARGRKLLFGTMLALGILLLDLAAAYLVFRMGRVLPVLDLPLFILLIYAYQYLKSYLEERAHRLRLSNAFRKYVAPQVVDQLAKDRRFEIKLGGELRTVAVLFIDIRGFTPLSESLAPQMVVSILNEYFALVTKAIFDHGGTLDKFIGDAAMAVFNAPLDLPDYEYQAVCTALDIVSGAEALEARLFERHQKHVGFGIGINCGEAVVGNIGCSFRMDYTAIGDTVNTAARLESNAKKGQILVSEALYEKVRNRVEAEEIGVIPLKGKSEGVCVYNIVGKKKDFE